MAVRFTDDLVPIDDPPFFAEFSAEEHHFLPATMDLARRVIGDAVDTIAARTHTTVTTTGIPEHMDPRKLLALMEWWNSLPDTRDTMPWFQTGLETTRCIHAIKQHCHICHHMLVVSSTDETACECIHNEQYKQGAAVVLRDVERLFSMETCHQTLCGHPRFMRRELLLMEHAVATSAWTKVMNADLCQYLASCNAESRYWPFHCIDYSVSQLIAYVTLTTNQRPFATTPTSDNDDEGHGHGRGRRPVFARLHALDLADESKKRQVQRDLLTYLNNDNEDDSTARVVWTPQTQVLHRALRAIEKYERGMECTLLALGVEKVCLRQQWNVDKNAIVSTVSAFLGPPEQYDEAYMLEWWNMPLLPYEYSSTSLDCTSRDNVFLYPFVVG